MRATVRATARQRQQLLTLTGRRLGQKRNLWLVFMAMRYACALCAKQLVGSIILVAFARQTRDLADETAFGSLRR